MPGTKNNSTGSTSKSADDTRQTYRVRRLRARLTEATELHALSANPLLTVVTLERMRRSIARCMWGFLSLGLGFTTTGVQDFLAGDRSVGDPVWWGSWAVEPALAGILITLLRWEAEMYARGVTADHRPAHWLKRVLLGSTLVMNVSPTLWPRTSATVSPGMVFVHVVIPVVVFLVAEVMPVIHAAFAEAIRRATPQPTTGHTRASVAAPAVAAPATPVKGAPSGHATPLTVPPAMVDTLTALRRELAASGRDLTPADVQRALRVPADYAARITADLALNGHAVSS